MGKCVWFFKIVRWQSKKLKMWKYVVWAVLGQWGGFMVWSRLCLLSKYGTTHLGNRGTKNPEKLRLDLMIIWKCFCGNIILNQAVYHSEWEVPVLIYLKHFFAILSHHSNKIVAKYARDHFSVVKYIHTDIRNRSRDITQKYLCFKRPIRLLVRIYSGKSNQSRSP